MNVSGEFTINAPRAAVFDTIRDPKSFISLVDGIRDLKEIDPTHYEAVFETKIAYLNFKFKVTVEVIKLDDRRDRGQDRGHAARRRRPPDRDHAARRSPTPATKPRSPIRSMPRSPASSAAWASR